MQRSLLLTGCILSWLCFTATAATTRNATAPAAVPTPQELLKEIESALQRAATSADLQWEVINIAEAAILVDPSKAPAIIRSAAQLLEGKAIPATHHWGKYDTLAAMACHVAPHDEKLRDELLRKAIPLAKAALAEDRIWQPPPLPPGWIPETDPKRYYQQCRQLLDFNVRVWETVIASSANMDAAAVALNAVVADARKAGSYGSDRPASYRIHVLDGTGNMSPSLLLAVLAMDREMGEEQRAWCTYWIAYERYTSGRNDSFTRTLNAYAIDQGIRRSTSYLMYAAINPKDAWAKVQRLAEQHPESYGSALCGIIEEYAWIDLDEALALAEAQTDPGRRRDLLEVVCNVWAYRRPESIDRAVQMQDNEVRRGWALKAASQEMEHRRSGHPPRDTKAAHEGQPTRMHTPVTDLYTWRARAQRVQELLQPMPTE